MDEKEKLIAYKPPSGCRTLVELTSGSGTIAAEAAANGHDGFLPVPVVVRGQDGKSTVRGQVRTAPLKESTERGRFLTFVPTKERVTIVREKVGKSYSGDDIHEVVSREGKKFLASRLQLKER